MEIRKFLGIRNTTSPERLKTGELVAANNVETDNTGRLLSRRGQTLKNASPLSNLYANHAVAVALSGSNLVAVEPNFTYTTLKVLTSTDDLSYETSLDTIYYSNGVDLGRLVGRTWSSWGIIPPAGQPVTLPIVGGKLPIGKYMYAVTFVRNDGHESGTGLAGVIELTAKGGISFLSIPVSTNTDVVSKNLYLSATNGEVLYYAANIPNAQIGYTYNSNQLDLTIPLITQFLTPPPPGSFVKIYKGVMYVVVGDTVYYSNAHSFELFKLDTDFLRFPGRVVMFEGVGDGIYVGTEDLGGEDAEGMGNTYFLSGNRPDKLQSVDLFDYGVIEGTAVSTDAAYFESPVAGEAEGGEAKFAVVWTSRHGICLGKDGGTTTNLTEPRYSMPLAQSGVAFVRQARGYASYIVNLQGVGANNNAYIENIN